jgi:hypothetical protein
LTSDGKPYGPYRYKQLVKERYFISKHSSTSYADTGNITPTERMYMLDFIATEIKRQNDEIKKLNQQRNN